MWSSTLFSLATLFFAIGLIAWHVRTWRRVERSAPDPKEYDFRRRQLRRRVQTSGMLGVLAVAIFISPWMTGPPWLFGLYCFTMLVLVLWVAVLAMIDLWVTRHYYQRLRDGYLAEEAKLQAELRRLRAAKGNGKARRDEDQ
jgi:peptidoglycan/LPS O-acetylase OafA/YrhL